MKSHRLILALVFIASFSLMSIWVGYRVGSRAHVAIAANAVKLQRRIEEDVVRLKNAHRFSEISKTPIKPADRLVGAAAKPQTSSLALARQRTILIIGIDDLRARHPQLISVWMAFYLLDTPHFMLVPIYPSTSSVGLTQPILDDTLASLFRIDTGSSPGVEFIQALQAKDLWWTGYILLDRDALESIRKFAEGNTSRSKQNHILAPSSIPDPRQNLKAALMGQTRFAQDLCRSSSGLSSMESGQVVGLIKRLSSHFMTDLDLVQVMNEIQTALKNGGGISCEFPSLETPSAQP